ncbi:MAG TPA: hypothetical protein VJC18_04315, partial [bacterium]|nr:hypothetical protein [bacterium]
MLRKIFNTVLLLSLFVGFMTMISFSAKAETLVSRSTPRMMQGVRPLGMGGAFVAVAGTDENALFYNPAAINDFPQEFHFQFLLPTAEFSYKSLNFLISDVPDLVDDIDAANGDSAKIDVLDAFAASNTGRYEEIAARGNVITMMHKYITASLFYETHGVVALLNPSSSTVDMELMGQAGLQLGSAYSFFDDYLQAGVAVKLMERYLVDETVTQRDVIANAEFNDIIDYESFGFGVGVDVGFKGTFPVSGKTWDYLKPKFAFTVQDVGHTRFFAGDPVGRQKESMTFGLAVHPDFWKFKSIFAIDMRDLEYRGDFFTKFHAGYELTWPEISKILRAVSLRVGVNQIYVTGGVGFDFKYFKM